MALSPALAKTAINGFFDRVEQALSGAASEAIPLLGTLASLPGGAAVATLFAPLRAQVIAAVEESGATTAAALATALNDLGLTGLTASATPAGGLSLGFDRSLTVDTGAKAVDLAEAVGSFFGLGIETGASCTARIDCTLLIAADGTASLAPQATPEVSLGVAAELGLNAVTAKLGVVDVTLSDADPDAGEIALDFGLDLAMAGGVISVADTTLTGHAGLDLRFAAKDIVGGMLPDMDGRISVGFALDGEGGFAAPGIGIHDLRLDLGSYMGGVLTGLFADLSDLFEATPVRQIVDVMLEPIPGLNTIGQLFPQFFDKVGGLTGTGDGKTTVGDLAAYQNSEVEAMLDRWYQAVEVMKVIQTQGKLGDLGTLDLQGGQMLNGAITSLDSPEDVVAAAKLALGTLGLPTEVADFFADWDIAAPAGPSLAGGEGLTLHLLENPVDILKLFLSSEPVDIVSYDLSWLSFKQPAGGFFPVVGPLGFELSGQVAGSLGVSIGYDTQGLLDGTIYNGLYLTTDAAPQPGVFDPATNPLGFPYLPMGAFATNLRGGVGVGYIANVTVGGGFDFSLFGYFEDSVSGGKFRPGEGLTCLIDPLSGVATADLSVKIGFGFGPFSLSKKIVLASATLADFTTFTCAPATVEPTPIAPGLATALSDRLRLNVGADGIFRLILDNGNGAPKLPVTPDNPATPANERWNETYVIANARDADGRVIAGAIDVSAFGFTQRAGTTQPIRADFGEGDDLLVLQSDVTLRADVSGGAGEDVLTGGLGDDILRGGADTDILTGGGGNDKLYGDAGDDQLSGGAGADLLDGGAGFDLVDYSAANTGTGVGVRVTINRFGGARGQGGEAEGDDLRGIESVIGTAYDDDLSVEVFSLTDVVFDGGAGNDRLTGAQGNDLLIGGIGADVIDGRGGLDGTSYVTSWGAVDVDLTRERQSGGDAEGDRLISIESVGGSTRGDRLSGTTGANHLFGFEGDDVIDTRGGADVVDAGAGDDTVFAYGTGGTLDGGPGRDVLSYARAANGVVVDLGLGVTFGPDLKQDRLALAMTIAAGGISSFEVLIGSAFADSLTGDVADNVIEGGAGDDLINGQAGADWIMGGQGADQINGGTGVDWVTYSDSDQGVIVDLATGGRYGTAEGDRFTAVENVQGSAYADTLRGNNGANVLDPAISRNRAFETVAGGRGTDTLRADWSTAEADLGGRVTGGIDGTGAGSFLRFDAQGTLYDTVTVTGIEALDLRGTGGNDTFRGRGGNDTFVTGDGDDWIEAGGGADRVLAGAGNDYVAVGFAHAALGATPYDAGKPFLADGGAGIDTFSLSLQGMTTGIFLQMEAETSELQEVNFTLPNGSTIRNFERLRDLHLSDGSDVIRIGGRQDNTITGGAGSDLLESGLGFDSVDGGQEVVLTSLPSMTTPNRGSGRYIERDNPGSFFTKSDQLILDYSSLAAGASVTSTSARNESGVHVHYRAYQGGDVTLFDFLAPIYTNSGTYTARDASGIVTDRVNFSQIERVDVTGSAGNDTLMGTQIGIATEYMRGFNLRGVDFLHGGAGNDLLFGLTGSDRLYGGDGNDYLSGSSSDAESTYGDRAEIDELTGGAGADRFIGGTSFGKHYTAGGSWGVVLDFNTSEGDVIQLTGRASDYWSQTVQGVTRIYSGLVDGTKDPNLILEVHGSLFSLTGPHVSYVAKGPGFPILTPLAVQDVPKPLAPAVPFVALSAQPAQGQPFAAPLAAPEFSVTRSTDPATLLTALAGEGAAGRLSVSGHAASFGTFTDDPFGLGSGVILSTGRVEDLPGPNTVARDIQIATPITLDFEEVTTATGNRVYRADLTGLDISSLTFRDSDSRQGGAAGEWSGFDLDGFVISRTFLSSIDNASLLNNRFILPRLNVIDYANGPLEFDPGSIRAASSILTPSAGLRGSENALIDGNFATLDRFADGGSLTLGDGGRLGVDLSAALDTSRPTYLYVAEDSRTAIPDLLDGLVTVSSSGLTPKGDLSTDLGLTGAADDGASLSYAFTPPAGQTRFSLEVVLFSEELPERISPNALSDTFSIRLNGREIGALSNGADLSLSGLVYSGSQDLKMNAPGSGGLSGTIRADGYTRVLTITGEADAAVENLLTIAVRDGADGHLDSGMLIREGAFKFLEPERPILTGTAGRDVLTGTAAAEEFRPLGGFDHLTLGLGADVIRFHDTIGKRDVLTIADFDQRFDELDLNGATIASTRSNAQQTVLNLAGADRDMIVLLGVDDFILS